MDYTTIITAIISALGGGGLWAVIKAKVDKRKTPYDMLMQMMAEQKKFYEERNAEYEREKLDSAEKSSVIMQSHNCEHRFQSKDIHCPVDEANNARLKRRCDRCDYKTKTIKATNDETGEY